MEDREEPNAKVTFYQLIEVYICSWMGHSCKEGQYTMETIKHAHSHSRKVTGA